MRRIRFSLRLLILLVTAVGLFLGYSQYRRREIQKVCEGLKADGYVFAVPQKWHDYIWQRKPVVAWISDWGGTEVLDRLVIFDNESKVFVLSATADKGEMERIKKLGMVEYR
jgi:hypothetical protein